MSKWDFALSDGSTLHVQNGSGHWSQVLNIETGQVTRSVYVFEAQQRYTDGTVKQVVVLRNQLYNLRKVQAA
ncbi:MAG: hypothetical protein ACXWP0_01320 [Ktedonobacterales bacterium]